MTIEILNLKLEKPSMPYDVKIDRSSPLGNPFYMSGESERGKVCEQYREWLRRQLLQNSKVIFEVNKLKILHSKHGKLRLFCWCAPLECHGASIKAAVES